MVLVHGRWLTYTKETVAKRTVRTVDGASVGLESVSDQAHTRLLYVQHL